MKAVRIAFVAFASLAMYGCAFSRGDCNRMLDDARKRCLRAQESNASALKAMKFKKRQPNIIIVIPED